MALQACSWGQLSQEEENLGLGTDTQEERHETTEAEIGVTLPQTEG